MTCEETNESKVSWLPRSELDIPKKYNRKTALPLDFFLSCSFIGSSLTFALRIEHSLIHKYQLGFDNSHRRSTSTLHNVLAVHPHIWVNSSSGCLRDTYSSKKTFPHYSASIIQQSLITIRMKLAQCLLTLSRNFLHPAETLQHTVTMLILWVWTERKLLSPMRLLTAVNWLRSPIYRSDL